MTTISEISAQHNFRIPNEYEEMCSQGLLSNAEDALRFSDVAWLSPDRIANWSFQEHEVNGFVPFAKSARRDLYCWCPARVVHDEIPIFWCPVDARDADWFAPDFLTAVLRFTLEEFSGSWLVDECDDKAAFFLSYVTKLRPFVSREWCDLLGGIASRSVVEVEPGTLGLLPRAEADALFRQMVGAKYAEQHMPWHSAR